MKSIFSIVGLAVLFIGLQSLAFADTPAAKPAATKKSITKVTCQDYKEMEETIKPKFIYYAVGYNAHGRPVSVDFDVEGVEKIKPVLDEFCAVNLTKSAYDKVIAESIASERKNR